ncbi:hypothetical protein K504DRAFT_461363 [Pleomassaria siparia CBS 279.74]|uniref:Uncharacterized protein n=1 Tax=Pleomassaria siparia CBS 279.74 TaxID=1314801 RepID=A0A6G1JW96_9PLEO|nr:hypothetical protein K504DRAFT_461363 [Pleomassaria siparia CBS 279.74]
MDRYQGWNGRLVRDVLDAVPDLTNLSMEGVIREGMYRMGQMASNDLRSVLQELKSAPHLSHLGLPSASDLGLDYEGGPGCGNVYAGVEGREYGRYISREHCKAVEEAAKITFEMLPDLKSLRVGDVSPVEVMRDQEGGVMELKWAWTGRMPEYLDEIWPGSKEGSVEYEY